MLKEMKKYLKPQNTKYKKKLTKIVKDKQYAGRCRQVSKSMNADLKEKNAEHISPLSTLHP